MQQTGRVTVKADGDTMRSKPGASIDIGGEEREGGMTDQKVFYFKEKLNPAMVKCTLIHCSDTDVKKLRSLKNIEVQYETDTGVVLTVANAVTAKIGELANGEVDVTFTGSPA
jgi:hypothetical protein